MGLFGDKTTTEYGYRTNKSQEVWCSSKGEAQRKIKRINNKTSRTGIEAKLIQRTVKNAITKGTIKKPVTRSPKDQCVGGKCTKRGNICKKHFKAKTGDKLKGKEWSLEGIHARWDEEGHRWG
jgi:hypothetical protein